MNSDEDELRRLFQEVPVPPGVGNWRQGKPRRPWWRSLTAAVALTVAVGAPATALLLTSTEPAPAPAPLPSPPVTSSTLPTSSPTTTPSATRRPTRPTTPVPSIRSTKPTPSPKPSKTPTAKPVVDKHAGDLILDQPGADVGDLEVTGTIYVRAKNVTLTRVTVQASGNDFAIRQEPGAANLTISTCELSGAEYGLRQEADGLTVRGCDIHDVRIGVAVGNSAKIADSHIHDLRTDSAYGVYSGGGGSRLSLSNTTIVNPRRAGAAVMLDTAGGPQVDVLLQGNRLSGGQFALYAGAAAGSRNIRIIGNRLGKGSAGHFTGRDDSLPGASWRDNTLTP